MGYKSPADVLTMAAASAASALRVTATSLDVSVGTVTVTATTPLSTKETATVTVTQSGNVTVVQNAPVSTKLQPYSTVSASCHTASAASSAQRFPSNSCVSVAVKALPGNTGNIWIGGSTVSNTIGFVLDAGDAISLRVDNTNLIYYWADTVSDKVCWIIIN